MKMRSAVIFSTALAMAAAVLPAWADCYDVFGCTDKDIFRLGDLLSNPTCDFLWVMRNAIYKEHGYCFRTARGISNFGNEGCTTSDANALGLNAVEKTNVATIAKAEKVKACP